MKTFENVYYSVKLFDFYLTMILTLAGIIILFGFARKLGPKVNKILLGLSSIVLFIFGIYQLWQGIIQLYVKDLPV